MSVPTGCARRPRSLAALAALACCLTITLSACTDVIEEQAPAPSGGSGGSSEQRRPEGGGGGEVRTTEPNRRTTTAPPTTKPTKPTEFPPSNCPTGLVC